jgi:hypothetical protein
MKRPWRELGRATLFGYERRATDRQGDGQRPPAANPEPGSHAGCRSPGYIDASFRVNRLPIGLFDI